MASVNLSQIFKTRSRKFGQWRVTIGQESIKIIGDFYSNFGVIYDLYKGPNIYGHVQRIGTDNGHGLTPRVLKYINRVLDSRLEQLNNFRNSQKEV